MVAYTYSRVAALNFNTTPPTVARSATGSVYAIADTTFTTPLTVTMVVGGSTTTTISSDANGFFPDFTVNDRTSVVWKQASSSFTTVLTTSDPVPGPQGTAGSPGATGPKGDRGDLATWQASTFYPLNQVIANPSGDLVKVTTAHTSGGSYDATKFGWVNNNAANLTGTLPEASLPNVPDAKLPARLQEASLNATYGRNTSVWTPPGTNGATNRTSLQSSVDAAILAGDDLLLNFAGTFDIDGTVNVTGKVRIFGLGRGVTTVHQVTKPLPTFYVTGQDATFEDFTGSGDGPSFTMGVATFQNYNVIRVERGAHGFTARRLGFTNHYIGILVRNYPNDPVTGVTTPPVRTERVVVEDMTGDGVWSVLHGGPFDSPSISNIRGRFVNATGHADTTGHAPHLVYINTPTPADGIYTDAYYTRGGTVTNLSAWDGPDYVGAAFSFKYMRGTQIDNLTARNCRGVIETQGVEDTTFGLVNSTLDKYPATGTDATRASVSLNTSTRVRIKNLTVDFAAVDHGKALRFENGSNDNEVENIAVVERSTVDRRTGDVSFPIYLQGQRNTVKNANITNLGQPKYRAVSVSATGSGGRLINPRIGAGYTTHIGVDVDHLDALIDYDPIHLTLDRTIPSARLTTVAGNRAVVRDRSIGQTLPPGFVDEFERGVTVTGLATTDDGKTWLYKDSGAGNPASWQANAGGDVKYIGAAPRAAAIVDGISANGTVKTTIGVAPTGNSAGLAARVTDWNNYIGLGFNWGTGDGKLNLFKRVGGTLTTIIQSAVLSLTTDAVVELALNGTSVSAKLNGVEVIAPQTITDFSTVTLHGLLSNSAETALTWKRIEFIPA